MGDAGGDDRGTDGGTTLGVGRERGWNNARMMGWEGGIWQGFAPSRAVPMGDHTVEHVLIASAVATGISSRGYDERTQAVSSGAIASGSSGASTALFCQ